MRRLALLFLLAPALAAAQGTGVLTGRVVDNVDAWGLPGVSVLIEGTTLGAATDPDGYYRITGVPAGTYTVTASYAWSTPVVQPGVEVRPGHTRAVAFMLKLDSPDVGRDPYSVYRSPYGGFGASPFASRIAYGWEIENLPVNR